MDSLTLDFDGRWHVALNKFNSNNAFQYWMYEAKRLANEVPRMVVMFGRERRGELPTIHRQCSHAKPEKLAENFLSCCLGKRCSECPYLHALEAQLEGEELDRAKAWTCASHIQHQSGEHPHRFDTSEGYIQDETDKLFWSNVYKSLSSGS